MMLQSPYQTTENIVADLKFLKELYNLPDAKKEEAATSSFFVCILESAKLFEISVQKALEALAVSCLVAGHLMDAVMQSIKAHLFALLGESSLAGASAVLSSNTNLKVGLCAVGDDFTQHLGISGSVISLLKSSLAIESADLRIALADRCSGHSQIHTNLGALACELSAQEILHIFGKVGCDADLVLRCPGELLILFNRLKFGLGLFADRALPILGKISELHAFLLFIINMAAYCTSVFH